MKILQVINQFHRGGGAEKFLLDLSLALSDIENVSVDICSLCTPLNDEFIDKASQQGLKHVCLSDKPVNWKTIAGLRKIIKHGSYDVVHVHLFPALYLVVFACMFMRKRPKLIYTEHSTSNRRRGKRLFQLIEHFIYKKYDSVIAISDEVELKLTDHARIGNTSVIHNGIDIKQIDATAIEVSIREELRIPQESVVVTMVGRFVPGKDYSTLIQSLCDLPLNVHIVCVGDGPLRNSIQSETQSRPFANRVHFLGLRSDVIAILKSSDIIVLSTEHEGFSISMLEAMACGKPFVASAVPGIEDVVGNSALLFEYQNSADLAEQISKLFENKETYQQMSEKSRLFAENHDINIIAKKYLIAYAHSNHNEFCKAVVRIA